MDTSSHHTNGTTHPATPSLEHDDRPDSAPCWTSTPCQHTARMYLPSRQDDSLPLPEYQTNDRRGNSWTFVHCGHRGGCDCYDVFDTIEEPLIIASDAGVRYTDGDRQQPRLASIGVFLGHGSLHNVSEVIGCDNKNFTSDRAEIKAAICALQTIEQLKGLGQIPLVQQVVLKTDFKLIVDAMTDFVTNEWRLNSFTRYGQPILHRDLWWQMEELVTELYNEHHVEMLFFWTPRRFNGAADWLAGAAMDAWDTDWKELESLVS
ncbi:hypothetical protein LTR56_021275 [Elasticomyces elasticus]|nr:hypothetical protein LTR56_021275 [Elasticomyces elasticus]KAK3624307.1 hypothetical protein LTR22_024011 [Elasticomyces elasticus]KAK4925132.1 hypothetical protein LTR49_007905 [Elasticomyces elasticus]KAK5744866.1 hypothetical protein LTS12_023303 [Elasticomyces elasticus]